MANEETKENVKKSIASIYSTLLNKRKEERALRDEQKRLEKEERKQEEDAETNEGPMSKKEKRQAAIDTWKEVIVGLTGDDLDYVAPKKKKKKYRKWIDDDIDSNVVLTEKSKKRKKRNYKKEFDPELNMLKNIVAEQNKFTQDLQRRYQTAAGPNTRDAMPLNKTLVELAAVINASRSNSLGILREIGNLKKTVADLYMKQFKLDAERGGVVDTTDVGLMGSSIASSLFGNQIATNSVGTMDMGIGQSTVPGSPVPPSAPPPDPSTGFPSFDPATWDGGGMSSGYSQFEAIPHKIVVEYNPAEQKARYKAVRDDNGEELIGCPVPSGTIKSFDLKSNMAKDDFDQIYPLELVS